jgi:hypothetical protein
LLTPHCTLSRALAAFVALVVLFATGNSAPAAQVFAPESFWNAPLAATAPLAADSDRLVAELQNQVANSGPWINTRQYSVPVYAVPSTQARVRVHLDNGYPPLQTDFADVPLPANAVPAPGTDAHLAVLQPATDTLWEFWKLARASDGWHARWGGKMRNVSRDPGYFPSPLGATGSGLPVLGGLMRIGELRAGHIDHALALGIPAVKAGDYVWPAQRTDGSSASGTAIPEGTRFRLDPNVDVDELGLPRITRMIALAAQRYGIVIRDFAGAVTLYGEDPGPTGEDPYPRLFSDRSPDQLLADFPWGRLQVVAVPGAPDAISPPSADSGGVPGTLRVRYLIALV